MYERGEKGRKGGDVRVGRGGEGGRCKGGEKRGRRDLRVGRGGEM